MATCPNYRDRCTHRQQLSVPFSRNSLAIRPNAVVHLPNSDNLGHEFLPFLIGVMTDILYSHCISCFGYDNFVQRTKPSFEGGSSL